MSLTDRIQQLKASAKGSLENDSALPTQNSVYNKVLKNVAFIGVTAEDGDSWQGTGWVLDRDQRLIVTNHHVIEGVEECEVFFPLYENGKLVTNLERSLDDSRAIKGRILDSDQQFDLALIQVERLPSGIISLPIADKSAAPGQRVHSIAGNTVGSQSLWSYSTGYVR